MKKQETKRIASIDIIRGYFLFVIIIDHLGRYFGFYDLFTGGGTQWVSAAEGFFFVSGIMIGLVRGRKLINEPMKNVIKKVWSRVGILYIWSVLLTVLFTGIAQLFITNPGLKEGAFHNEPVWHFINRTLTLRYNYGWADFLVYYVLYLLIAPCALYLLRRGLWKLLLALSVLVWVLGNNVQLSWQLLFYSGCIVGFYLYDIENWFTSLKSKTKHILSAGIVGFSALTIALSLFFNTLVDIMNRTSNNFNPLGAKTEILYDFNRYHLAHYFDKYSLGIGRLVLFYFWFAALYIVVRRYEKRFIKYAGWFFTPLGQNSLYVYIMHAVILFIFDLFVGRSLPIWLNILVNTVFLLGIWALVKTKFLFKIIPR